MNATLENPEVRIGRQEGLDAFEIHVDDSGTPAGFTQFLDYDAASPAGHDAAASAGASSGRTTQRIFPHTAVKDEFGGHGLASILVQQALDQSIAAGYRIVAICPYVKAWLLRHKDYAQHTDKVTTGHIAALESALTASAKEAQGEANPGEQS